MAGDWIKFEVATSDKPEVWSIAQALSIDPDAVVGKMLRVWAWFDQHTTNGNAPSVTCALLDRCVGVTGFCKQVTLAGWMNDDGETISLPNFEAHNGETAKKRCQTAKRVAKHKKSNASGVTNSVTSALPREDNREEKIITQSLTLITSAKKSKQARKHKANEFAMSLDWTPSVEFEKNLPPNLITAPSIWIADLLEFCTYRKGTGEQFTQSEWEHKFLQNLEANKKHRGQA